MTALSVDLVRINRMMQRYGPQADDVRAKLPLFLFFAILEPVITFVPGLLALLSILTALFWKLAGYPHFPFLLALGASLGLGLMLAGYQALLRLLAR